MDGNFISIIIPHHHGEILSECLRSLFKDGFPYEREIIVVADGALDDGSVSKARRLFPSIRVVRTTGDRGFAGACNLGAQHARGDFLVFLNNDVKVTAGWLEPILHALQCDPSVAVGAPKILSSDNPGRFDYSGGAGGLLDKFGYPYTHGRIFHSIEKDSGQYDEVRECFWVSGAAMLVRARAFTEVEKFDESLFMQMEEIDLCWRLRLRGYRAIVFPESVVYHLDGYTLPHGSIKKCFLNHRNNLILLFKNLGVWRLWTRYPIRLFLELASVIYVLFRPSEWKRSVAALSSLLWIASHPLLLIKLRRRVQRLRRANDPVVFRGLEERSIVVDYFFLGIKSVAHYERREKQAAISRGILKLPRKLDLPPDSALIECTE